MENNLNLYYIFYAVAKAKNISGAAKELYISQPAISKSIQKLDFLINFLSNKTIPVLGYGNVLYNDSLISNIVKVEPKGSYYCIGESSYKVGDEYSKTYIYYDSKLYHYRIENEFDD